MGALIPLAISLAPQLARWLLGPGAENTAKAVEDAAVAVTGSTDLDTVANAIKDPEKAAQLTMQFAQIAADKEKADRAADLEELKASIQDVEDARKTEVSLASTGSPLAWVPAVLSAAIVVLFGIILTVLFTRDTNTPTNEIVSVLVGTLAAMVTQVGNFWLGSSKGSVDKQGDLKVAMANLAQSVPANAVRDVVAGRGGAVTRPF